MNLPGRVECRRLRHVHPRVYHRITLKAILDSHLVDYYVVDAPAHFKGIDSLARFSAPIRLCAHRMRGYHVHVNATRRNDRTRQSSLRDSPMSVIFSAVKMPRNSASFVA